MNQQLLEEVVDVSGAGDRFIELYAGVGNFTIHLAKSHERGLVAESSPKAKPFTGRNLEEASSTSEVEVVTATDAEIVDRLISEPRADLFLADPPRAGMKPLTPFFAANPPNRVVLVSCHPMAALRDIRTLLDQDIGYELKRVTPFDLFPQTPHLEIVAVLDRQK